MNIDKKYKLILNFLALLFLILILNPYGAYSQSIERNTERNEVDDLDIIAPPNILPNALIILDLSLSMGLQSGGTEIGRWTNEELLTPNKSNRLDVALWAIFNLLDEDKSLERQLCRDLGGLSSGTIDFPIPCSEFMRTPFRDLSEIVREVNDINLPLTSRSPDNRLIDQLTGNDATRFPARIKPMTYSGARIGIDNVPQSIGSDGCTDSFDTWDISSNDNARGFINVKEELARSSFRDFWRFFRRKAPRSQTPLAKVLGLDDNPDSTANNNSEAILDALKVYKQEFETPSLIDCRNEFVIIITDGEDTCSPENTNSGTTNINRRNSIKAVSNLRTYFSRNPVDSAGTSVKKEIRTFVIGLGIDNTIAKRTLNAMALAGGTHTNGLIKSSCPETEPLCVDINDNSILPSGSNLDYLRTLSLGPLKANDPNKAHVASCNDNACFLGGESTARFEDSFFDGSTILDNFAFFADNADELSQALNDILTIVTSGTLAGTSPAAPQTSGNITLRDRIFLTLFSPIADENLWQGRLALYSFIDDPNNSNRRIILQKPTGGVDYTSADSTTIASSSIFNNSNQNNSNQLVLARAQNYHWEAGKNLAERNLGSDSRNVFTVKPVVVNQTGETLNSDDLIPIDSSRIIPSDFGITDLDIKNPPQAFCIDSTFGNCGLDCNDTSSSGCKSCIKTCLKDRVVSFLSGNTEIIPVEDDLGIMGINCPDPDSVIDTGNFEECALRLGDIFHSTPKSVASPSVLFFDTGFQYFATAYKERSAVVYAGANDGMLHAFHAGEFVDASGGVRNPFTGKPDDNIPFFDTGNGSEMFGFIPPTFLSDDLSEYRLGDIKNFILNKDTTDVEDRHRAFFDGTVTIADVFIDGFDNGIDDTRFCNLASSAASPTDAKTDGYISTCGKEWHTVLISGFRNGGGGLTALNITNAHCNKSNNNCLMNRKFSDAGKKAIILDGNEVSIFNNDSSPDYPEHLWTLFDQDFGNSWSNPVLARVRLKARNFNEFQFADRWVAFVGGGIDPELSDTRVDEITPSASVGNAFYAIDIPTGRIIYKFHPDNSIPKNLGADQEARSAHMECELASDPGVFDINSDGYADTVYIGDTCGRLWRFDVSQPITAKRGIRQTGKDDDTDILAENWSASIAFCANSDAQCGNNSNPKRPERYIEPIFFAPTVVVDDLGRRHVIFLTGNRRNPTKIVNLNNLRDVRLGGVNTGKLYNFIDSSVPSFLSGNTGNAQFIQEMKTRDDLSSTISFKFNDTEKVFEPEINQSISDGEYVLEFAGNNDCSTCSGNPISTCKCGGEKGIGTPVVINRLLIFTTFLPTSLENRNECESNEGEGRVYAIDYLTGQGMLRRLIAGKPANSAGQTLAKGIPSAPSLSSSRNITTLAVTISGASGANFLVYNVPIGQQSNTVFWQEIL